MFGIRNARYWSFLAAVPAIALATIDCTSAKAEIFLYNVSIPTDALSAADGPYTMLFELTDGSGVGDANNTVTLTNFNVSPNTPVTLTDNEPLVYDEELFTPNSSPDSTLDFELSTTNNANTTDVPDEFSFYILDGTSTPLTTTDDLSSSLFYIDLGGDQPVVTTFESIGDFAGVDPTVTPYILVPEPEPPTALFAGVFGIIILMIGRRIKVSQKGGSTMISHV